MMSTASLNDQSLNVKNPQLQNQGERSGAWALYRQALQKNAVLAGVFTSSLLLFQPLMQFLRLGNVIDRENAFDLSLALALYRYALLPISFVFLLILTVRLFNYVHQNQELDLWHQLPLRRGALLGAKLAALLTLLWLPHLLNLLVLMFLRGAYAGSWSLGHYLTTFLQGQLMLIACLALLLCFYFALGNSFDGVAAFFAFNFSWVFTLLLLFERLRKTWPGYELNWSVNAYERGMVKSPAPLAALFINSNQETTGWVIYWVVFALLGLALSYWLYRQRPSERAGQSSSESKFFRVISIMACLCAGQMLSLFFRAVWDNRLADALGFVIGSLLAHVVIELIAARGTSTLLKSIRYYVVTLALALVVLLLVMFDAFGYARYAPDSSELKTVVLYTQNGRYESSFRAPLVLDAVADRAAVDALLQFQHELTRQGQSPGSDIYWPESAELRRENNNSSSGFNLYMIDQNDNLHSRTYRFSCSDYAVAVEGILQQKLTANYLWPLAVLDENTNFKELHLPGPEAPAADPKALPSSAQKLLTGSALDDFLANGRKQELIRVLLEDYRALLLTPGSAGTLQQRTEDTKYPYDKMPFVIQIDDENMTKILAEHLLNLEQVEVLGLPSEDPYFRYMMTNEYAPKEKGWFLSLDAAEFPRTYAWLESVR